MKPEAHSANWQRQREAGYPSLLGRLFFVLLLTGPPKFRLRDPWATLYGELDPAVLFQAAVWVVAGAWILFQLKDLRSKKQARLSLSLTQKLGLLLIVCLALSILTSVYPTFTAFKVYQLLVLYLFGLIFVWRYGAEACFDLALLGNLFLCGAIAISAWVAPDIVLFTSETGAPRLRGLGIAETGIVAPLAIILLLTTKRRIPKTIVLLLFGLLSVLVFFSLGRIAYVVVAVFFALALLRGQQAKTLKWIAILVAATLAVALLAGLARDFSQYRDPESVWTLSERLGLWAYLIDATLSGSPWIGLGYQAATRSLGMEYEFFLPSGHSLFIDVFTGGGLLSLAIFLWLWVLLSRDAIWLFRRRKDSASFVAVSLFMAVFLFGLIGADLSDQAGFTFWLLVSLLPTLRRKSLAMAESRAQVRPVLRLGHQRA
jgi:hypothetical protein